MPYRAVFPLLKRLLVALLVCCLGWTSPAVVFGLRQAARSKPDLASRRQATTAQRPRADSLRKNNRKGASRSRASAAAIHRKKRQKITRPGRRHGRKRPAATHRKSKRRVTRRRAPRLVLDAGHGGKDPGAMAGGLVEKKLTLRFARSLAKALRHRGIRVLLTRSRDRTLSLDARLRRAAGYRPDLFVSLHCNASPSPEICGLQTFAFLPKRLRPGKMVRLPIEDAPGIKTVSSRLARAVHHDLVRGLARRGWRDGGVKLGRFKVLTLPHRPCLLLELGYLTNKRDARRLRSAAMRRAMVRVLARSLSKRLRQLPRRPLNCPN